MVHLEQVGVIGAGVIGRGVAEDLLRTGHAVVLIDVSTSVLADARHDIQTRLRLHRLWTKAGRTPPPSDVMSRLRCSVDYEDVKDVDFVIENVTERWAIKQGVYETLDAVCRADCAFGANTSAIEITRLAALTRRPDRVVGLHFMNPVPFKPTVEMVRGRLTSEATIDCALQLLRQMGKTAIVVADSPGFVSNRVLMLTINEAVRVVDEGVASAAEVDRLFRECFGHKMGPLETADLIGLDTVLLSLETLAEAYRSSAFEPASLLRRLVASRRHGQKTGEGFYSHDVQGAAEPVARRFDATAGVVDGT